ncbi:kinase-like domain-containing protein [Phellopilus nigrolimitatus]|nr:kinase-like domain-containing protein [Phellopilus nigrolimitatus]
MHCILSGRRKPHKAGSMRRASFPYTRLGERTGGACDIAGKYTLQTLVPAACQTALINRQCPCTRRLGDHMFSIFEKTKLVRERRKLSGKAAAPQTSPRRCTNRYVQKKRLGKGVSGEVWRCEWYVHGRYVQDVAMKIIPKHVAEKNRHVIVMERNALRMLYKAPHKNIIRFYDYFYDPKHQFECFVFDLAEGGDLFSRLLSKGTYPESDAANAIRDTLEGLEHLDNNNLIHRDVKPDNILFRIRAANSPAVISDFGLAKRVSEQGGYVTSSGVGTPKYMAPESYVYGKVSHKSDVWAVGVTLYMLLTGLDVFWKRQDTKDEAIEKIKEGQPDYDCAEFTRISPQGQLLIKWMLEKDPRKRPNATEALNHDWFKHGEAPRVTASRLSRLWRVLVSGVKFIKDKKKEKGMGWEEEGTGAFPPFSTACSSASASSPPASASAPSLPQDRGYVRLTSRVSGI